jgi:transcriptional regulator with XRE-family HTH domain
MRRAIGAVRRGRQPEVRVSAGPSRRRLARLRADGLSLRRIAELTGCGVGTLQHLARGDRRHVALSTQLRLAAVVR